MKHSVVRMIHKNCRNNTYPKSNIVRVTVPDNKVSWTVEYSEYSPVNYTASFIEGKPWSDPNIENTNFKPKWNVIDDNGLINRVSFVTQYAVDNHNYPLNPIGRTGIKGRGILGRWGPNHAADPIVTRWKRNNENIIEKDKNTNKQILQFIGIQRRDSGQWAIPGGMVDPGEKVINTLLREFMEEAMNSLQKNQHDLEQVKNAIETIFKHGEEIYKGYVDDPRNTDNAWMETTAVNFHDESGEVFNKINLEAGDDAKNVEWIDIAHNLILYANHKDFIMKTTNKHKAHW